MFLLLLLGRRVRYSAAYLPSRTQIACARPPCDTCNTAGLPCQHERSTCATLVSRRSRQRCVLLSLLATRQLKAAVGPVWGRTASRALKLSSSQIARCCNGRGRCSRVRERRTSKDEVRCAPANHPCTWDLELLSLAAGSSFPHCAKEDLTSPSFPPTLLDASCERFNARLRMLCFLGVSKFSANRTKPVHAETSETLVDAARPASRSETAVCPYTWLGGHAFTTPCLL